MWIEDTSKMFLFFMVIYSYPCYWFTLILQELYLRVASLDLQELVQNAEDAGARSFKIFYKEGDDVPASQTSKSSYRSYFRVLKQSDWILI